jgi:endonuclease III
MLSSVQTYPEELGIDLKSPAGRFKWFLASILFAKRISNETAKRTYKEFERAGLITQDEILRAGWDRLVEVLDSGGYVRYDFSTASKLLDIMNKLKENYGSLEKLYSQAKDSAELERTLLSFKGIGPVTVNIFLRELRKIWPKARPKTSLLAIEVAKKIKLKKKEIERWESQLVRVYLEYCKKKRCAICPVKENCHQ